MGVKAAQVGLKWPQQSGSDETLAWGGGAGVSAQAKALPYARNLRSLRVYKCFVPNVIFVGGTGTGRRSRRRRRRSSSSSDSTISIITGSGMTMMMTSVVERE